MEHNSDVTSAHVSKELSSFQNIWKGGYFEGSPQDFLARSSYGMQGYVSVIHGLYLGWVVPHVPGATVLEIGPGRGAWTKAILGLGPARIYALDALSAEHNGFWDYVGRDERVVYHKVSNFTLDEIPESTIDYFFTFGVLCHVSPETIETYIRSLHSKMKIGAFGVMMVADYDKHNQLVAERRRFCITRAFGRLEPLLNRLPFRSARLKPLDKNEPLDPRPGRWYHCGKDRCCEMLTSAGFTVLSRDIGITPRDPIIFFMRRQ